MHQEWASRIGWTDLPSHVRAGVEVILGAAVSEATSQQGGFSPGSADTVRTVDGRRAFVKAVGSQLNEHSPAIHRREAAIAAKLPETLPVPSLMGTFDDGEWVALVFSEVQGRHPHIPWRREELMLVLDALLTMSLTSVPPALEHLPTLEHELSDAFNGWARIRKDPSEASDPWVLENLDALQQHAERGRKDLAGRSLVHTDIRADNILITPANRPVFVDWPWACIGSGWVDALSVLVNVRVFDPDFDVDAVLQSHGVFAGATADSVNGVLSGFGAYLMDVARQPAPPGLPTVRAFQRRQGEAVVRWLRHRLSAVSSEATTA